MRLAQPAPPGALAPMALPEPGGHAVRQVRPAPAGAEALGGPLGRKEQLDPEAPSDRLAV